MKRGLVLLAGTMLVWAMFGIAQDAHAGCCTITATNECKSERDLDPGGQGLDLNNACITAGGPQYIASCECPAQGSTQTVSPATCCVYAQGSCQAAYASGQCPEIAGLAAGQFQAQACDTLFQCTGKGRPPITASSTPSIIKFKPQIPLPGSSLFNGQEIIITGSTLGEYIAALYAFVVSAIGILATTMVFYGGIKWVVAAGDRGKIQDAKETISSAVIGLIFALTAYVLLLTISPKLVKFTSLSLTTIKGVEQTYTSSEVAFGAKGTPPSVATLSRDWLDKAGTGIRTQYGALISSLKSTQIPEDLIYAIIYVESGGRPELTSKAGACGIMQLLPTTAGKTCTELKDPFVGIEAGVTYLKKLAADTCPSTAVRKDGSVAQCKPPSVQATNCSNGDLYYVAAAYNGGAGANCGSRDCAGSTWWECKVNTGYQETRNYVIKVEASRKKLQCLLTTTGACT